MDDLDVNDKLAPQPLAPPQEAEPVDARAQRLKEAIEAAAVVPQGGFVPLQRPTKPLLAAPPATAAQAEAQTELKRVYDVGMHNGYVTGVAAGVMLAVVAGIGAFGVYKAVVYAKSCFNTSVGASKSIVV